MFKFRKECNDFLRKYSTKINSKNTTKSNDLRKIANKAYLKKDFTTAMESYNESLVYAPYESVSYFQTICNISAVLFEIEEYEVNNFAQEWVEIYIVVA